MTTKSVETPEKWSSGYGAINYTGETRARIADLASRAAGQGRLGDGVNFYELLQALDRLCSAAMWLVVHQTYTRDVRLDGRSLAQEISSGGLKDTRVDR